MATERSTQDDRKVKARVCLLLPTDTFCDQLQQTLGAMGVLVSSYQDDLSLFARCTPEEIDCLVLATGGATSDGLQVLEALQRRCVYVPAVVIVNDAKVVQAVRAMRALAVECFDQHTPIPIIARHVRSLAQRTYLSRSLPQC